MNGDTLEFSSGPITGRTMLLMDAARRIEALQGHLGEGGKDQSDDGFGNLVRGLAEDKAEFGPMPNLLPVQAPGSSTTDAGSNPAVRALDAGFTFWWMRIPLDLFTRKGWAFTRLEVGIEFSPDEKDPRLRPQAYDILPNRRFDEVMSAGAEVAMKLGGDAHFSVDTGRVALPPIGLPLTGSAGAEFDMGLGGKVHLNVGFTYKAVAARINHTSEGLPEVRWRLDGAEFFQDSQPQLIVILQVPRAAGAVQMRGLLYAYRRFNIFPAGLQTLIRELPEAMRVFFRQGAPIEHRTTYDIGVLGG